MQRLNIRGLRRSLQPVSRRAYSSSSPGSRPPSWAAYSALIAGASGALGYAISQASLARTAAPTPASTLASSTLAPNDTAQYGDAADFAKALKEMQKALKPEQVSTDKAVLTDHGGSNHHHHSAVPHRAVIYPSSTEDVVAIVNTCRKYRIPIVPFAGGTSLEGHTSGVRTLLVHLDARSTSHDLYPSYPLPMSASTCPTCRKFSKSMASCHVILDPMRILLIDWAYVGEDSDLVCQAGATWEGINEHLAELGLPLFFPVRTACHLIYFHGIYRGVAGPWAIRDTRRNDVHWMLWHERGSIWHSSWGVVLERCMSTNPMRESEAV